MCMFFFGTVTVAQGTVKNYSGLLTTRFLLGLFESSIFPGSFYLITMYALDVMIITQSLTEHPIGGTNEAKLKSAARSSSHPLAWLVPSAGCSLLL